MADYNAAIKKLEMLVPDLDIKAAIKYCAGSKEFYADMLKDYANSDHCEKIERFYGEKDWHHYGVEVHALKSTSRTLGFAALGDMAEAMQHAAERNDTEYIESSHGKLISSFKSIIYAINKCFEY